MSQPPEIVAVSTPKTPLTEALDRIFNWHLKHYPEIALSLQPGLSREEINEKLKGFPYRIPEEVYQLYQWRNGMHNYKYKPHKFPIFVESQEFLPLEKAVKKSEPFLDNPHDEWEANWLFVFDQAHDNCGAYVVVLGDEELAPVRNYDERNYSLRYPSLTHMMLKAAVEYSKDLSGAYLKGVNMSGFQMSKVNLSVTNFAGADLSRTDLSRTDLSGANLSGAKLYRAGLFKANLTGANLTGTNFTEADLEGANLDRAVFGNTIMPDGSIRNE